MFPSSPSPIVTNKAPPSLITQLSPTHFKPLLLSPFNANLNMNESSWRGKDEEDSGDSTSSFIIPELKSMRNIGLHRRTASLGEVRKNGFVKFERLLNSGLGSGGLHIEMDGNIPASFNSGLEKNEAKKFNNSQSFSSLENKKAHSPAQAYVNSFLSLDDSESESSTSYSTESSPQQRPESIFLRSGSISIEVLSSKLETRRESLAREEEDDLSRFAYTVPEVLNSPISPSNNFSSSSHSDYDSAFSHILPEERRPSDDSIQSYTSSNYFNDGAYRRDSESSYAVTISDTRKYSNCTTIKCVRETPLPDSNLPRVRKLIFPGPPREDNFCYQRSEMKSKSVDFEDFAIYRAESKPIPKSVNSSPETLVDSPKLGRSGSILSRSPSISFSRWTGSTSTKQIKTNQKFSTFTNEAIPLFSFDELAKIDPIPNKFFAIKRENSPGPTPFIRLKSLFKKRKTLAVPTEDTLSLPSKSSRPIMVPRNATSSNHPRTGIDLGERRGLSISQSRDAGLSLLMDRHETDEALVIAEILRKASRRTSTTAIAI